jgi:hypothetical protein
MDGRIDAGIWCCDVIVGEEEERLEAIASGINI